MDISTRSLYNADVGGGGRFLIQGLGGQKKLHGSIAVRGAKNAALKALAASLLFKDELRLKNVPDIEDVDSMISILEDLGIFVKKSKLSSYSLHVSAKINTRISGHLAKRLRASVVLTGPILARYGKVFFPHPGGCVIGARPIDIFVDSFKKMGARVKKHGEWYEITAGARRSRKHLAGAELLFKNPSVTATETLMMAAILAEGKTVIKNAAREAEIKILADFLNKCGARIQGAGSTTIEIKGGPLLRARGKVYKTPPDRIEAGSLLILGALAAKDLRITHCDPSHLESLIDTLRLSGVQVCVRSTSLQVINRQAHHVASFDIKTNEYPGFPTDLQAPMTVFLTQAHGKALVFETIFEGRLNYVHELIRMGADIMLCDPHRIIVRGKTVLHGRELESPDLRAGLAFVIAAVVAKGQSIIHNVYNIDRGYDHIEKRLQKIGVQIKRTAN